MALTETPKIDFGQPCPDFTLPDATGTRFARDDLAGPGGLVVAFICNHCPYVIRQIDGLAADLAALAGAGVGACCIMPNDWTAYPADAPDRMGAFAAAHGLTVPYLVDETQAVARAMGAVCTPDLFGYGPDLTLRYRGRPAELRAAMEAVTRGADVPDQVPGMGCSIKWR
ncbi:thioredoxin family protein [Jannaschia pagri]|uniref:Thioredoxin family protein n=1 Tax=Jannaschia pagri TaxID=2829797 RepID=A0ABQ4NQJ9_9RHOB|nr:MULTISPECIES: thioredoxin family protein [unclassified Jannaschia]GIT92585.1 thioredoxin family protein [Jannaschia sp. AI_61]GIT96555.1 thioredoxin family protein [Jannaschia sp. AI_62]